MRFPFVFSLLAVFLWTQSGASLAQQGAALPASPPSKPPIQADAVALLPRKPDNARPQPLAAQPEAGVSQSASMAADPLPVKPVAATAMLRTGNEARLSEAVASAQGEATARAEARQALVTTLAAQSPPRKPPASEPPPIPTLADTLTNPQVAPLSAEDARRGREAFAALARGDLRGALALRDQMTGEGRALIQADLEYARLMHPDHRSSFAELSSWLAHHHRHPGAERIHALAVQRQGDNPAPRAPTTPPAPRGRSTDYGGFRRSDPDRPRLDAAARGQRQATLTALDAALKARQLGTCVTLLREKVRAPWFSAEEQAIHRAAVARLALAKAQPETAVRLVGGIPDEMLKAAPEAAWVAGLAAYANGDPAQATWQFLRLAESGRPRTWAASAVWFWVARSAQETRARGLSPVALVPVARWAGATGEQIQAIRAEAPTATGTDRHAGRRAALLAERAAIRQAQINAARAITGARGSAGGGSAQTVAHPLPDMRQLRQRALEKAAEYPASFYGLLATAALAGPVGPPMEGARPDARTLMPLTRHPVGRQALALAQVGEPHRAGRLLSTLDPGNDRALAAAMLAVIQETGPANLSLRLGEKLAQTHPDAARAARYPVPQVTPEGGYTADPTLLWAIVRTESRFDPQASNGSSGAAGMVQMLPSTAAYLNPGVDYTGAGRARMMDPAHSLWLGNRYLVYLAESSLVEDDLARLLVAYNAGPGTLQRILRTLDPDEDPLLFIEAIPLAETRAYLERVMADRWLYRRRLGLETPGLYALLDGRPARLPHPPAP